MKARLYTFATFIQLSYRLEICGGWWSEDEASAALIDAIVVQLSGHVLSPI